VSPKEKPALGGTRFSEKVASSEGGILPELPRDATGNSSRRAANWRDIELCIERNFSRRSGMVTARALIVPVLELIEITAAFGAGEKDL
jgi:hypothetical protein